MSNRVYVGLWNHYGPHETEPEEVESDPLEDFIASYVRAKQRSGVYRPYPELRKEAEQVFRSGRAFCVGGVER